MIPEIEEKILEYSLEYPTHGQVRVSNELKAIGITVSCGGILGVWLRHEIVQKKQRLKRLERFAAEIGKVLTESQVNALETAREEKAVHGEIETYHPGFFLAKTPTTLATLRASGRFISRLASTLTPTWVL